MQILKTGSPRPNASRPRDDAGDASPTNPLSILITGCSSGIGLSAAEILSKKGYRVFATARKEADVKNLQALGLESFQMDINDSGSIHRTVSDILDKTNGTLDALFNNAGFGQLGAVEDLNRDLMRTQFETNVFGPMELITLILPVMRKQGHGRIIQNSSILGSVTLPYYGAYNASKFALEGFTHTLRQELRGTNIFVSIIAPGPTKTRFGNNAHEVYKKTLCKTQSVHSDYYHRMETRFSDNHSKMSVLRSPPKAVVKSLIAALESRSPRTHYYIGFPAKLVALLHRLLPDLWLDKLLIKASHL
jgi:short-subunit dehydrogenase